MSNNSQKLKQRAELISILSTYRNAIRIDNNKLKKDIDYIATIDDKAFIFKTLLNEITSTKSIYSDICSIIIFEAIENELFKELSVKLLQNEKISDDKKILIMSLMKQKGLDFEYHDIVDYIDNPEDLAHNGIKDFLKNALTEPEVQLDLLDFYLNIPQEEKIDFLENLESEFDGDNLANAFSILAHLKLDNTEFDFIFNALLNSSSPYALSGLNQALENKTFNTKTKAKLKRVIKKISQENPDFLVDFLTKNSTIYKSQISFVDGRSDFSMIFSRKKEDELIDTLLLTINTTKGITSCMGFNSIDTFNYQSIIKRLFSDSIPIDINPIALKSLFIHYTNKTKSNNLELPYELIVWKNLLNDVRSINFDVSEFINSKLEIIKLTQEKVKKFITSKVTETWFYSYGENCFVDEIIDKIELEHCTDLDTINEWVDASIEKNFLPDQNYMSQLKSRLLLQSYVASLANLKITSACAYSLCFKNPYIKMLISSFIDKSIYYTFMSKLQQLEKKNIFRKIPPTKLAKDEVQILMAQLEEKWK
ncbi:MAG: hypothetical protein IKU37_02570 [Candidatus Gastranaerophilales bacterium]|nr:hypothetical protein [Candidatus Gastranaerophilales bacterium]